MLMDCCAIKRRKIMRKKKVGAIIIKRFALPAVLVAVLGTAHPAMGQDAATAYPKMAPIERYLMDSTAEIALARSAAPASISGDAEVLVLGRHGYEVAVKGKNGWVCMVGRGWGIFDWPEFWNPKIRAASCVNPPAARSTIPLVSLQTKLLLAGHSKVETIAAIKAAFEKKELPAVEPGGVSYMMSKSAYLTDNGNHNGPHLMFYVAGNDPAAWGANLANSPVMGVNYWYLSEKSYPQLLSFPPITVFLVGVDKWSDGTAAPSMSM
jgi:hypothetical protein